MRRCRAIRSRVRCLPCAAALSLLAAGCDSNAPEGYLRDDRVFFFDDTTPGQLDAHELLLVVDDSGSMAVAWPMACS